MNELAVVRGANIRRVFLITDDDRKVIPEFDQIMDAQIELCTRLKERGRLAERPFDAGYYAAYRFVTERDRSSIVRAARHVGVIVKKDEELLVAAIYREDGTIVSLQFRGGKGLVDETREYIESELAKEGAQPVPDYRRGGVWRQLLSSLRRLADSVMRWLAKVSISLIALNKLFDVLAKIWAPGEIPMALVICPHSMCQSQ